MYTLQKHMVSIDKDGMCHYENCASYPNEDVSYNILNVEYPYEHIHDHWEILFISQGKILHIINNKKVVMNRGDICLIRPQDIHAIYFLNDSPNAQHISFSIKKNYMKSIFDNYGQINLYQEVLNCNKELKLNLSDAESQKIINKLLNIRSVKIDMQNKIFQLKLTVNQILTYFIEQLYSPVEYFPNWMINFLAELNNPYLDIKDVKTLATLTPYSYSRLAPIFKSLTGRTIVEYITIVKIKCAKDLLKNTDNTIVDICSKLGYESASHFIRTFKRETCKTPNEFRKNSPKI